ncbi:hypothetical protein pb186bvf_016377 [Paramecium bursaria]
MGYKWYIFSLYFKLLIFNDYYRFITFILFQKSLEPLQVKQLKVLDISFCNLLTNQIIQSLIKSGCRLEQLHMASIDNISGDMVAELIAKSKSQLKQLI